MCTPVNGPGEGSRETVLDPYVFLGDLLCMSAIIDSTRGTIFFF